MKITKGKYTVPHSDLYIDIKKISYQNNKYFKVKACVKYKSNDMICEWFSRDYKNFKFQRNLTSGWIRYNKEKE